MKMSKVVRLVRRIVSSPGFFKWIVAIFIVQAAISAVFISISTPIDNIGGKYVERRENGVVPDGHRHMGAIYYYSERPILASPVIGNMSEDDLWMGDLVRFPSYFYYYALSFPVRIATALNLSDTTIVLLVRFIGIAIGVCALLVFRRITQLISRSVIIQNISSLSLALTGSFVWLAAAENYDMSALLLWFLFIYNGISLFVGRHLKYIYWMAVLFFFLSITKYTFIPFAGLFGLISVGLYVWNSSETKSVKSLRGSVVHEISSWWGSLKSWQLVLGSILLIIGAGLFTERIVGNILVYRSFNPNCEYIHSHEGCMSFGVYSRDYRRVQGLAAGTADRVEYTPVVGYPAYWIKRYYDSMYVYMGHVYIPHYSYFVEAAGVIALLFGIIGLIWARVKRIRLFRSQVEWYAVAIVGVLTVSQFIFNLNSIIYFGGQTYAHQGRYLLSVIGFSYIIYLIALRQIYKRIPRRSRVYIVGVGIIVALYSVIVVSAIPSFFVHAINPSWYSDFARHTLPEWIIRRN
jgi:hypothetical protein